MSRLELMRADWLARFLGDLIPKIDRSSGRDHEKLVSSLISHEMALRAALRSVQRNEPGGTKIESAPLEHVVALIRSARAARDETMRSAGLLEDLASARTYLGETPATVSRPLAAVPEVGATDRIRFFGRPFTLMGNAPGIDQTSSVISLAIESRPWDALYNAIREQSIVPTLLALGLVLVTAAIGRRRGPRLLALSAALGLAAITGGPTMLLGGAGLAAAGWKMS
jgi:hypothetical protein